MLLINGCGRKRPFPYELLLEFVGAPDGTAAQRLAQVRPSPEQLGDLWEQLVDALLALAGLGLTHGDLSPYNLLVHDGRPVLIDLPQAVDVVGNPGGMDFLDRDVRNVTTWFAARGLPAEKGDPEELLARLIGVLW